MRVFFLGLGYCAEALIRRTPSIEPSGTARTDERVATLRAAGVEAIAFDGASVDAALDEALERADAVVVSIPPRAGAAHSAESFAETFRRAQTMSRIVYYSTVGVYGEHGGHWVDERSATLTRSERGLARLADERRWTELGAALRVPVDVLRLPGIYGPGRNALRRLREGDARRIVKPGHLANRAHVDDIAEVTRLVLEGAREGQIWNVADDEPAPPQDVIVYAAGLLGVPPPPEEFFDAAGLSEMSASFFADEKRVSNAKAKALIGFAPHYPSYREGLRALFEAGEEG